MGVEIQLTPLLHPHLLHKHYKPRELRRQLVGLVKSLDQRIANLMLRHRMDSFNPQRGRCWGVSFDWFNNQGVVGSKVLVKLGRLWWKVSTKSLPVHKWNCFTWICGGMRGWTSLIRASHIPRNSKSHAWQTSLGASWGFKSKPSSLTN